MEKIFAVVMAAGKGTRMRSTLPKVLCPVLNRPMIDYTLSALRGGGVTDLLVVIGHQGQMVREKLQHSRDIQFIMQHQQKGTGHAVMMCQEALRDYSGPVVVVAGDAPLMQPNTIRAMIDTWKRDPVACLIASIYVDDPTGLGRIIRNTSGDFMGIVEEKDATFQQRLIREVNQSYYLFNSVDLFSALCEIKPENAQAEYYLTDCPAVMLRKGLKVRVEPLLAPIEATSVNTPEQLAQVERILCDSTDHGMEM